MDPKHGAIKGLHCINKAVHILLTRGPVAHSVVSMTAYPGVTSSILVRSHTFVEIGHEIISTAILNPSADSRSVVFSYKHKYVHEVLVNCLVKGCSGKKCV